MKTETTKIQPAFALPNVYSDHMVFQRDVPITIAGTASPFLALQVHFDSVSRTATANATGHWSAEFPPLPAGTGHVVRVAAPSGTTIELRDVAVGDVWIAGGQSNMEFPVVGVEFYGLKNGAKIAAEADDPDLRILKSARMVSPDGPCENLPQGAAWRRADSAEAVGPCSAVGYLFGKLLRKRVKIPIGIVSTNWGGCRIEPWIDEGTLRRHGCEAELARLDTARKAVPGSRESGNAARNARREAKRVFDALETWLRKSFFASDPATTKKALASWAKPGEDLSGWDRGTLAGAGKLGEPGVVWFRRDVEVPEGWNPAHVRFTAHRINDTDEVFWDGVKIGETWIDTPSYWSAPRDYAVPASLAKPGRHVLAIRVANHFRSGGVGELAMEDSGSGARESVSGGDWFSRVEFRPRPDCGERPVAPGDPAVDPRNAFTVPSTLFNAMFAPLSPLRFRGAIWYQGCSNVGEARNYERFQKYLVESWRKATRSPDMAFLQVQLAGFEEHRPTDRLPDDYWTTLEPTERAEWAELREAQSKIRKLRLCDFVTATDIGDHSDIHPADKYEVARRLEAAAAKMLYGAKGVTTGPSLASVKREGDALRCTFSDTGAGLVAKPLAAGVREIVAKSRAAAGKGKPSGRNAFFPEEHAFAVAGADGKWAWADARLDGNAVVVSSPAVKKPTRVRYAWSSYPPSMRLFNKDGFPAFPFQGAARG